MSERKKGNIFTIVYIIILAIVICIATVIIESKNEDTEKNSNVIKNTNLNISLANNTTNSVEDLDEEEYEYIYDTDIPDPKSVLGYEDPFTIEDTFEEDGKYYANYSELEDTEKEDEESTSDIKSSNYEKYAKLLLKADYELINSSVDEEYANIYVYSKENLKITLRITDTSFEITINKNND